MYVSCPPFPRHLLGRVYQLPRLVEDHSIANNPGLHDLFGFTPSDEEQVVVVRKTPQGAITVCAYNLATGTVATKEIPLAALSAAVSTLELLRAEKTMVSFSSTVDFYYKPTPSYPNRVAALLLSPDESEVIIQRYGLRHAIPQYALRIAPMEDGISPMEHSNWPDVVEASTVAMYRTINLFVHDQDVANQMCALLERVTSSVETQCLLSSNNGQPVELRVAPFRIKALTMDMWRRWVEILCDASNNRELTTFVCMKTLNLHEAALKDASEMTRRSHYLRATTNEAVASQALIDYRTYEAPLSSREYPHLSFRDRFGNTDIFPLKSRMTSLIAGGYGPVLLHMLEATMQTLVPTSKQ